jgi:acetylglutamate kinase
MAQPRLTIIKIGGNIIDHPESLSSFLNNFAQIPNPKILVHGGGKVASQISTEMGIVPRMIDGRRITDADTLRVVTMVYGGLLNKQLVATLQSKNCPAIGLTGADANIILSKKRAHQSIDFGWVGDVINVNTKVLQLLIEARLCPIIAPLTHDGQGQILNTNADTIASELAIALSRAYDVHFFYCFEKKGLLLNINDDNSALPLIKLEEIEPLKADGTIVAGMIPKVDNIARALKAGVHQVSLCHAEDILDILSGNSRFGTIFVSS